MKTYFYLCIVFLFLINNFSANSQWSATNGPHDNNLAGPAWIRCITPDGGRLLVGSFSGSGGVYSTSNMGNSYSNGGLLSNHAVMSITTAAGVVYAGTDYEGLFYNTTRRTRGLPDRALQVTGIAVLGQKIIIGTWEGIFKNMTNYISTNDSSWYPSASGIATLRINCFKVKANNIYACTTEGICVSTNQGDFWTNISGNLPNLTSVKAIAFSNDTIYIGTELNGVYRTVDSGAHWQTINDGVLDGKKILSLAISGKMLFAGTDGDGVFYKPASDSTFREANQQLFHKNIYALAIYNNYLFAGTKFGGVYKRSLQDFSDLLISLSTSSPNSSSFCQASIVNVPYSITGKYNSGNVFTIQLSDTLGSFDNPDTVGSAARTTGGQIMVTIPLKAIPGSGYRMRVVSTDPVLIADDNGKDLTIFELPNAEISGQTQTCTRNISVYSTDPSSSFSNRWQTVGGSIRGPNNQNTMNVLWDVPGLGSVSLTQTNVGSGCAMTSKKNIVINDLPFPLVLGDLNVMEDSTTIYIVNYQPGTSNSWTVAGGTILKATNDSMEVHWGSAGSATISVVQTDNFGCSDSTYMIITINKSNGVSDQNYSSEYNIFPNPASSVLYIERKDFILSPGIIRLYNTLGEAVFSMDISPGLLKEKIQLSSLTEGIYILNISTDLKSAAKKLIIRR